MAFPTLIAEDIARGLAGLLPKGIIWEVRPDSDLEALLLARGDELARMRAKADGLIDEIMPDTCSEDLVGDWERILGLPDPCAPTPSTLQERRDAIVARLAAVGGHSVAYFVGVALGLGVALSILEYPYGIPFRVGVGRCGDPINDTASMFYWRVLGPSSTSADTQDRLECLLEKAKPAHTIVEFDWTLGDGIDFVAGGALEDIAGTGTLHFVG